MATGPISVLHNGDRLSTGRKKRLRDNSSGEIYVEELFPDDMGYDADVETIHPDLYEEPESDVEQGFTPRKKVFSIDEELAARMKHLGSERSGTNSPQLPCNGRGRKRRSLHDETAFARLGQSSDLEVVEILEPPRSNPSPPRKRRKKSQRSVSSIKLGNDQGNLGLHNDSDDDNSKALNQASASDAMDVT